MNSLKRKSVFKPKKDKHALFVGASKLVFYFRRIQTRSKRVQNKDRGHLFSLYVIVLRTLHTLYNLTTPLKLKADLFLVVFRSLREEAEYRNGFINLSKKMFRQPFFNYLHIDSYQERQLL